MKIRRTSVLRSRTLLAPAQPSAGHVDPTAGAAVAKARARELGPALRSHEQPRRVRFELREQLRAERALQLLADLVAPAGRRLARAGAVLRHPGDPIAGGLLLGGGG